MSRRKRCNDGVRNWIGAMLRQSSAYRLGHVGQRDFANAPGRLMGSERKAAAEFCAYARCGIPIYRQIATQKTLWIEIAPKRHRISVRGLVAAAAEAGR